VDFGAEGILAAVVAKAMGMDVIAFTASPRRDAESKKDTGYIVPGTGDVDGTVPSAWYSGLDKESLHNFLAQDIDILLLSVPLTDKTRHLLDKEEFEILGKKNAFVANISRGAIINHDELLKAARKDPKDGGLRGAALDVTEPEPLNADSELWDAPNITITPHISGISVAYTERSLQVLEKNLTNYLSGRPLINVVDRERGY
jgi:phosphoglycerate dehydrogenase-like enzyme